MKTMIEMAHEVYGEHTFWAEDQLLKLKAFEALVRADEREACAKVCDELVPDMSRTANDASVWDVATFDCAIAIRNRGNT
jgi:hypothetical protein